MGSVLVKICCVVFLGELKTFDVVIFYIYVEFLAEL